MKAYAHIWQGLVEFFLEWEIFQTKFALKSKKHFMFNNIFSENRAVYEIMWKKRVEPHTSQMKIWRTHIACRISEATNAHSEYIIRTGFLRQQSLHERASLLLVSFSLTRRYTSMNVAKFNFMLPWNKLHWIMVLQYFAYILKVFCFSVSCRI